MVLREELKQLGENTKRDLKQLFEKIIQYPLISLFFVIAVLLLIVIPHWQVSISGINNTTERATQENQDRATLAQMFGGIAIAMGLYYTWRRIGIAEKELQTTQDNLKVAQDNLKVTQEIAENNLKVSKEGQITERFTRAVDQLGNEKMEIRLGGIYALERISKESEDDYWPIIEILTAYVRKTSSVDNKLKENSQTIEPISMDIQVKESATGEALEVRKVPLDVQAVLTVLGRRKNSFNNGESNRLNLRGIYLKEADLAGAHLEGVHLKGVDLTGANLKGADLTGANLEGAYLREAHLEKADLREADLKEAKLEAANLKGALNLTPDQLSNVKTLYNAKLDEELEKTLREKYPALFENPLLMNSFSDH